MTAVFKTVCMLTVGEICIPYEFERKRIKRLNLRVRRDGTVHLSVPMTTPTAFIENFLRERATWIAQARARMLAAQPRPATLAEGDTVYIKGEPHTVRLLQGGRPGCVCREGQLLLSLRDTEDAAARVRLLRRFVKAEAAPYLTGRVKEVFPHFSPRPATFPTLSFRWMKSRWGSCTAAKNHITLNEKLLFVAPHLADYVIWHELCHFAHQDHSPAFYRHLGRFYPDYAAARRALSRAPVLDLTE